MSDACPTRVEPLIINDDAEAPALLNPLTGKLVITNKVGQRIIELADGRRSIAEIAAQISREFGGVQIYTAVRHTERFLASATQKGLVKWET